MWTKAEIEAWAAQEHPPKPDDEDTKAFAASLQEMADSWATEITTSIDTSLAEEKGSQRSRAQG